MNLDWIDAWVVEKFTSSPTTSSCNIFEFSRYPYYIGHWGLLFLLSKTILLSQAQPWLGHAHGHAYRCVLSFMLVILATCMHICSNHRIYAWYPCLHKHTCSKPLSSQCYTCYLIYDNICTYPYLYDIFLIITPSSCLVKSAHTVSYSRRYSCSFLVYTIYALLVQYSGQHVALFWFILLILA